MTNKYEFSTNKDFRQIMINFRQITVFFRQIVSTNKFPHKNI